MDLDDHTLHHEKEGACSCAVAQEVEQIGLFSTLHCRFTVDGTRCMNDACPYSHTEIQSSVLISEIPDGADSQ